MGEIALYRFLHIKMKNVCYFFHWAVTPWAYSCKMLTLFHNILTRYVLNKVILLEQAESTSMKKIIFSLLLGLGVINTAAAVSGDAAAGKGKAGMCAACHGANGISAMPNYPDLAGQHGAYIAKQLAAFKAGTRVDPVMAPMAAALSEQDMADLGAYFQSLGKAAAPAADGAAPVAQAAAPAAKEETNDFVAAPEVEAGFPSVAAGKSKSAACAACHGADGNSLVPIYPKLAGQSKAYLVKQITEFKNGTRVDPVMAPMVAGLSTQDIADISIYFSTQKVNVGNGKANDAGHKLYYGGDAERKITACAACHGAKGYGMGKAGFPSVGGQNVEYLKVQLEKFRSGARANDLNGIMTSIAKKLTDEDIAALSQTMSALK